MSDKAQLLLDVLLPRNLIPDIKNNKIPEFGKLFTNDLLFVFHIIGKNEDDVLKAQNELLFEFNRIGNSEFMNGMPKIIELDSFVDEYKNRCEFTIQTQKATSLWEYIFNCMWFLCPLHKNNNNSISLNSFTINENYHYIFVTNNFKLIQEPFLTDIENLRIDSINKWTNKFNVSPKKNNRKSFTKSIRHEVFKKYNYRCVECGVTKDQTSLHIDHILPISKGGTDELSNLQILCQACNLAKHNRIYPGET